MPTIEFEEGSKAVPVDFRRCRSTRCGDETARGLVHRTDERLPVTAFVHVVDCRAGEREDSEAGGADCSDGRSGNLYLQYWLYYADSATARGVPIFGKQGYHHDDWESVQVRISPDGSAAERASSHHGYNYELDPANWGSDMGVGVLREIAEDVGARPVNGWGPETHLLLVSGGSHAGNAKGSIDHDRFTPGRRVHLVPMEPIGARSAARFAVTPPWRKRVWRDPEYDGTD